MDFFGEQDRAKSNTTRLVWLFVLAVILTNAAVYVALTFLFHVTDVVFWNSPQSSAQNGWFVSLAHQLARDGLWSWKLLGWVTLAVSAVVGGGAGFKLWQLSGRGARILELLGGRPISLHTEDLEERRLLNVVEEMAIAAGIPVPEVYLLEDENGINALAAGHNTSDAAIGVTFGALKLLNRDELQSIVAHEFSHILNGDMRLNTRLIGWLHGILGLVVLGRVLTLSFASSRRSDPAWGREASKEGPGTVFVPALIPAYVLGAICYLAGSFGAFFARIVKSAVSRQREYLADASAVQFTRNPEALVHALKKIGGLRWRSVLDSPRAEEASHMYFSDGVSPRWFNFTSTHPPLVKRIRRIDPQFDGRFPAVSLDRVLRESRAAALYRELGHGKTVDFEKVASVVGSTAAAQEYLYAAAARSSEPLPEPDVPAQSPGLFVRRGIRVVLPACQTAVVVPLSGAHLESAARFLKSIPDSLLRLTREPHGAAALVFAMLCSNEPCIRKRQMELLRANDLLGVAVEVERCHTMVDQLEAGASLPLTDLCIRALRGLSANQYENFQKCLEELIREDEQIDLFEYMLQRMIARHLDPLFREAVPVPVQYYAIEPLIPECRILLSGLARIAHDHEGDAAVALAGGAARLQVSDLSLLPFSKCNLPQIDAAIKKISQASLPLKRRVLDALISAAATDGRLTRREGELLRAIADAFCTPLPPFLSVADAEGQDMEGLKF